MKTCIKCGTPTVKGVCPGCAEELVSQMSIEDKLAHALVGMDVFARKPEPLKRLAEYRKLSYNELRDEFNRRTGLNIGDIKVL